MMPVEETGGSRLEDDRISRRPALLEREVELGTIETQFEGRRRRVMAHIGGVPVEEAPLPLLSGVGAGLLLARAWVTSRVRRRRAHEMTTAGRTTLTVGEP
jgi:hypothetical protein